MVSFDLWLPRCNDKGHDIRDMTFAILCTIWSQLDFFLLAELCYMMPTSLSPRMQINLS